MNVAAPTPRQRPTGSAKSVLLTMLGELVVPNGGSVWTGTLVDGLAALGYSDRNARQAMARLRDDGVIEPERHGRKTRWHVTGDGDQLLRTGAERIYSFGQGSEAWEGRWLVVVCSIPEAQRDKRRRFQTRLAFAGFGFLSPTIAVSPHLSVEETATDILEDLGLADVAVVLRAETGSLTPDDDVLARSWDLDAIEASYVDFVETFGDVRPGNGEASFCELVRLVHAWRHFPFSDPELPPELLPERWPGNVARHLFQGAHRTWSAEATSHYKLLEAGNE